MNTTHLRERDYRLLPWKNGKGSTTEILIWPKGARFPEGDFLWRLSSAVIDTPSEFSLFPGYDRTLALIEGRELLLFEGSGAEPHHLALGDSISFAGEADFRAELPHGPVRDLNWFARRGAVDSTFSILKWAGTEGVSIQRRRISILYCIEGSITVSQEAKTLLKLVHGETAVFEDAENALNLRATTPSAKAALIQLS